MEESKYFYDDVSNFMQEFYGSMRQVKTSPMKLNLVAKLVRTHGCTFSDIIVVLLLLTETCYMYNYMCNTYANLLVLRWE